MRCYIIGVEDLVIDRLNGFVHWGWEDEKRWVGRLLVLHAPASLANAPALLSKRSCSSPWTWLAVIACWFAVN